MTGFEPQISGVCSDHSINCATTTAVEIYNLCDTSIETACLDFK